MSEETDLWKNEHSSCITVVVLGQNDKNLTHHSMQILVNFENGGNYFHLSLYWIVLNLSNSGMV